MRIREFIRPVLLVAGVFVGSGMCTISLAQNTLKAALTSEQRLSMLSLDNSNPALAFSPDGERLFAAWDGLINGNRRVLLRERVGGEWLPPLIVDSNPSGDNSFPSISVDASGTPHVSWISTVNDKRQPMYARRLSRFPNSWYREVVPFPDDSTVSGNCDYVNLQLDANNQPWIAWQYGFGNVFSIACSHYNSDGKFATDEITPGATSLNLYPELYFLPKPTMYWYLAQSDHFYLLGSRYKVAGNKWSVAAPENFENLPTDSLPDLFSTSRGPLAAIWYDRLALDNGDTSDRIFLGLQGPETKGRGEVVDKQPQANNHSVTGAAPNGLFITSWVSETYEDGSHIYLGLGNSPDTIQTIKVSTESAAVNSNPKVAGSLQEAAVAWEEKGGPGSPSSEICLRIAELKQ